jgi:hypothetical protein
MAHGGAGEGRAVLDEAVASSLARGTAWVRQRARAGQGHGRAGHVRLEGAADLHRRICVATESVVRLVGAPRFAADRPWPARREIDPFAEPCDVVYAGGSRYIAADDGWAYVAGEIDGPRRPSDPLWLLDALAYAVDCVDAGWGEVGCRLDLSQADGLDRSAIVGPARRWPPLRPGDARRRRDWLSRVPCVVAIGADGAIASMAFAALPPDAGGGLLWATTEFVEYGVPVEIPDLLARSPAAI